MHSLLCDWALLQKQWFCCVCRRQLPTLSGSVVCVQTTAPHSVVLSCADGSPRLNVCAEYAAQPLTRSARPAHVLPHLRLSRCSLTLHVALCRALPSAAGCVCGCVLPVGPTHRPCHLCMARPAEGGGPPAPAGGATATTAAAGAQRGLEGDAGRSFCESNLSTTGPLAAFSAPFGGAT